MSARRSARLTGLWNSVHCFHISMDYEPTRVWLDESNVIFRRGLAGCLTAAELRVVGESANLMPAPDLDRSDVLVFEIDGSGLSTAVGLARDTDVRLVGIARSVSEEMLFHAVEAGIAGFLNRADLTPEGLVASVRAVAAGTGSIPPRLLARLFDELARGNGSRGSRGQLAKRELDVLRLLAGGGSTSEIAGTLNYSERTVKNIVHDALAKLNCRTRAQAVAVVARQGVI
jgi:DNA-binding NarL/FixJ family response regulator